MQKRTLGTSSLNVSEIGLGCMSLPNDVAAAKPIIFEALQQGITYFDTADLYDFGANEGIVGKLIQGERHNLTIATKVGNRFTKGEDGWHWDASPAYIEQAIHDSLRRLGTDYIDLYQLHGGTIDDDFDAVIEVFERLKKAGTIRAYGISSIRPNVIERFLPSATAASIMMQYSLLDRQPEEFFDFIEAQGTSVVTRGTLAKGLLTNKWQQRAQAYGSYTEAEIKQTLQQLKEIYGDIHALALAFNLQHSAIASTVIGASKKEQLTETIQAYERAQSIADLTQANALTQLQRYSAHR